MLEFPISEYENRIRKLAEKMKNVEMDAIILTTEENTRYFSGFQSIVWDSKVSTPAIVIITKEGDITLISSKGSLGTMTATSCLEEKDIQIFSRLDKKLPASLIDAMYKVLCNKNCQNGRIGMEIGEGFKLHFNHSHYLKTMDYLKKATILDASTILWEVRSIKSDLEIEIMKKTCDINIKMYEKAFNYIKPGETTEEEVYRVMGMEAFRLGAEGIIKMGIRCGADRYSQGNCPPSNRIIGKGKHEVMLIDGGPCYKGYYSDIIRQAVVGKATDRQKEVYNGSVEACNKALSMIKPGVVVNEICNVVNDFIDKNGLGQFNYARGWMGHSIGMDVHETPTIKLGSEWQLKPGMILAVEPSIFEPGVGMFGIEQNILVTESGYELLTPLTTELIEL